nr:hypothetical protein [uncultured bacterium]
MRVHKHVSGQCEGTSTEDRTTGRSALRPSIIAAAVIVFALAACSSSESSPSATAVEASTPVEASMILVRPDDVVAPIDRRIFGTNVAVWIFPEVLADPEFHEVVQELGTTLLRFPGGSWSNGYEWAGCERRDTESCSVPWASRASDLADLMAATDLPGLWTVAFDRTTQETAAAVAFFNGDIDDDREIGVDRNDRDWQTVGHWARLRAEGGHADPVRIQYWEIGNEIYGAVAAAGDGCAEWGWEHTWTCDPAEYVEGDDEHDGYLDFRDAILAVDPTVDVGAIGIGDRGAWSDWDDTVLAGTGESVDFYSVHHYGSNGDLSADEALAVPRRVWPQIVDEVHAASSANGGPAELPVAITEHNMVAFLDGDEERLMTSAANAFYLSETIGQFASNGVSIANQWLLVNGPLENGTNYALIDPDGMQRLPAYYGMAMWARAGQDLVAVSVGADIAQLSVYGLRDADGRPRLMVLNPTSDIVNATVAATPDEPSRVTADVLAAESLEAQTTTYNGAAQPSRDLTEPAPAETIVQGGAFGHEFPPFSITLLRWWDAG